ncbi:hypothetical protein [Neobacillus sp. 204]
MVPKEESDNSHVKPDVGNAAEAMDLSLPFAVNDMAEPGVKD